MDYRIRTMNDYDVDIAVEWAAREGWNPGLHDAECFHAADPEGFFLGELDGAPVASISAVRYGEAFGFVGFYIVAPDFRGRGLGLQIWNAAMQRLEGRVVGLDGVVAQQGNYQKSGFELAWRNIRWQGQASGGKLPAGVVELSTLPFADVEALDRRLFQAPRTAFLQCWLSRPGSKALGLVEKGALRGYGVARACRSGWKVGPLFAETPAQAEALLQAMTDSLPAGETFFLDTPEGNPEAVALARRHGMELVFETARMYKGAQPQIPLDQLFGVTSFELG